MWREAPGNLNESEFLEALAIQAGHDGRVSKLGEGGMAEVYLAQDTKLGRRVAMKFLPPHPSADQQARSRLIREAQAVAALEHQNICAIYEVGEADGHNYIVMQYVEGETLHKSLQDRALEVPTL